MPVIRDYLTKLKQGLDQLDLDVVRTIVDVLYEAMQQERTVFIIGNGGSASTASHMACDLGKNTVLDFDGEEKRLRIICPSDNVATTTAYANDLGYDNIFEQPLKNFLEKDDIVIAISASGNSPNVVKAVEYANRSGAVTIGLVGFTGGKLKELCAHVVHFPEEHYGRSEDAHMILNHMIHNALVERKELAQREVRGLDETTASTPDHDIENVPHS